MAEELESYAYEFEDVLVEPRRRLLSRAGEPVEIGERAFDVLLLLIRNAGKVVERGMVFEEVWRDAQVESQNLDQCIFSLRRAFGDNTRPYRYIRSIPRQGLVFLPKVSRVKAPSRASLPTVIQGAQPPVTNEQTDRASDRYSHVDVLAKSSTPHVVVSCALYGALYSVAFLLETAYQFDHFWLTAASLAAVAFFTVFVTSLLALRLDRKRTLRGSPGGLFIGASVFIVVGLLISFVLGLWLPDAAITEAKFQTFPAQAAYLKNVVYFLPLGLFYMVLPFHFVSVAEREIREGKAQELLNLLTWQKGTATVTNAIYIRPLSLFVLLILALIGSQVAESHLTENLTPSSNMGLFVKLVQARRLLYFALGLECLLWYRSALNQLKKTSLEATNLGFTE